MSRFQKFAYLSALVFMGGVYYICRPPVTNAQATNCFFGLDDSDAPATLNPCESQDLLNVESNLTGTAALKRKGFTQEGALTVSTAAITGAHSFKDSSGNNITLVFHDRYASKSTNGGAFTNWLTTAPASITRWQCVDVGGKAYCVNDQRIAPLEYDGTTQRPPASMPQGGVIELCGDRMAISDISATPNRVAYSQSGVYTNFTTGTDSADPWTDDFGTPGDRVTGLKCDQGRLYIFKTASIISCILGDQYTTKCFPVSNAVGTLDPLSIVGGPDGIYFKSQDKTFWRLNADGLTPISQKISNLVKSQASGSQQSNTQTTLADWQAGSQNPGGSWSTGTVAGSVINSSVTFVDTSSAEWSGSLLNITTATPGVLQVSSTSVNHPINWNFEAGDSTNWTYTADTSVEGSGVGKYCSGATSSAGTVANTSIEGFYLANLIADGCFNNSISCGEFSGANGTLKYEVLDGDGTILLGPTELATAASPTTVYVDLASLSTDYVRVRFTQFGIGSTVLSRATLNGGVVHNDRLSFKYTRSISGSCPGNRYYDDRFDVIESTGIYFSTGQYVSRVFDTGFSTAIGGTFSVSSTTPRSTSLSFQVRQATSASGDWSNWTAITNGSRITLAQRYWQYQSSFTALSTATPSIQDVTLIAATTGQYWTQCIQPGAQISSWGILSCDSTLAGNGSLVYYATSAYSCAALPPTVPSAWTSVTNNATMSIAVSSAVYIGFRSLLTSATDQAQVNACTLYWNNGTLPQPTWGVYDPIKNAAYWSLAINNAATNNRVLKYDLNLEQWYPFDLTATALKFVNSSVYFGSSSSATWNKYGAVDADNGGSINAYWKSKDFSTASPFQETDWTAISLVSRNQVTGSMTGTWGMSNGQTGSYTVSLSTTSGRTYARSTYAIPRFSPANFLNFQFGNNSSTPFEVMGLRLDGVPTPWRPGGP